VSPLGGDRNAHRVPEGLQALLDIALRPGAPPTGQSLKPRELLSEKRGTVPAAIRCVCMTWKIHALGLTAFMLLAACERQPSADASPDAASAAPLDSQSTSTSSDPATASDEPPHVTASSAAASAPECKDLEKAQGGACNPKATGDPTAK